MVKRLLCSLLGHRWNHTLADVGEAFFYRIDCTRCGEAIDGAACVRLRAKVPDLYKMSGLPR